MKEIWIARYGLETRGGLNGLTRRRIYEGVLVRQGSGFGCVHPWPELGDPSLEECLADLAGEQKTRLVRRTMACVRMDGAARERGESLFSGVEVPRSHGTLASLAAEEVDRAVAAGFGVLKGKMGVGWVEELEKVREWARVYPELRWRLDFNGLGSFSGLGEVLEKWTEEERAAIDFLEDPVGYDEVGWTELRERVGIDLAMDRGEVEGWGAWAVRVVKPAVDEVVLGPERRVVTSYMDHPLGQCFAAYQAGFFGVKELCGLQTHGLFRATEATERLGVVGPDFVRPGGTGLGFDDLLAKEKWVKLR